MAWQLLFHHRDQALGDLVHLIPCKQVGDLRGMDRQCSALPEFPQPVHCQSLAVFSSPLPFMSSLFFFVFSFCISTVTLLICQRLSRLQLFIEQIELFNQEQIMFPFVQIAITKTRSLCHGDHVFNMSSVALCSLSHCQVSILAPSWLTSSSLARFHRHQSAGSREHCSLMLGRVGTQGWLLGPWLWNVSSIAN